MTVAEPTTAAPPLPERIALRYAGKVTVQEIAHGAPLDQPTWVVDRSVLADLARDLRDDPETRYDLLLDLCGADYPDRAAAGGERFEAVYHLCSLPRNARLRLKVPLAEADPSLPSLIPVWQAANWFEREAFDMFGFRFEGHPNLVPILLPDDMLDHFPLRKDNPLAPLEEWQGEILGAQMGEAGHIPPGSGFEVEAAAATEEA